MGITYPAGFTDDGDVVEKYKVLAMPTTVFIDRQGRIFQKRTGALDQGTITRLAKAMLDQDVN
jgi:thioredoxin-related protein